MRILSSFGRVISITAIFAVLLTATQGTAEAKSKRNQLPQAVVRTIQERFPDAKVTGFGKEREQGVRYYEVNLCQGESKIEVEVAPDGNIGEIESKVSFNELSADDQTKIRKGTHGGRIIRVEKHQRIGRPGNGTFVPLKLPTTFYEVKYYQGNRKKEVKIPIGTTDPEEDDEDDDDEEEDD